jgi:hypothetical protein
MSGDELDLHTAFQLSSFRHGVQACGGHSRQ